MYDVFHIENFKSIGDVQVEGLGRVNIFAGKNNVGKSSLLEALFLASDRLSPLAPVRSAQWRGMNAIPLDAQHFWRYLFRDFEATKPIVIELIEGSASTTLRISEKEHNYPVSSAPSVIDSASTLINPRNALSLEYIKNGEPAGSGAIYFDGGQAFFAPDSKIDILHPAVFSSVTVRSNQEDAARWSALKKNGIDSFVLASIRIMAPAIKELSVLTHTGEALIYADIGANTLIPLALLGEGTCKLAHLLLAISAAKGGMLMIDEIENGFHHSIMPHVWNALADAAKRFDAQVFATTHSYEMLSALIDDDSDTISEEFRYFRMNAVGVGKVEVISYTAGELSRALLDDRELR